MATAGMVARRPCRPPLHLLTGVLALMMAAATTSEGAIPTATMEQIGRINGAGLRLGIVVPNAFEMSPLLQSSSFVQDESFPFLDFAGSRKKRGEEKQRGRGWATVGSLRSCCCWGSVRQTGKSQESKDKKE